MKTEWIEKLKELEIALDTEEQVEIPDGMFTDLMEYIDNSHRFSECPPNVGEPIQTFFGD